MKVRQVELLGVKSWQIKVVDDKDNSYLFSDFFSDERKDIHEFYEYTGRNLVCWLDKWDRIKEGSIIDLKGVPGFWKVYKIHNIEMEHAEINRTWHVGGL